MGPCGDLDKEASMKDRQRDRDHCPWTLDVYAVLTGHSAAKISWVNSENNAAPRSFS